MRNLEGSDVSNLVSDSRRNFSYCVDSRFTVHHEGTRKVYVKTVFLIFLKIKGSQKKSVFFFLIILNFLQHDTDNVKFFCNMILIRMIREERERIESDRMDTQLLTFIIHC